MGQLISNLKNGSLVKLNENGGPIKFIKLDNDHYGSGTGVTMIRKDAYAQTAWNAAYSNYNVYIGCTLDNICDVIFPSRLDPEIQRCIVPVPIIVAEGNQVSTLHTIRRRGFALSCTEVGVSGWQTEGKAFAYFDTNEKRIAYLDGTATAVSWGLRSPRSGAINAYRIYADGSVNYSDVRDPVFAARPAFNLKYTYKVPGIQKGSEKSPVIINETLFYKGRNGVYAYNGGTPELISDCFGTRRFSGGVAGSDGERYYLSMSDETGTWHLYVYDTLRGIWLREDNTHALDWAYLDGKLYYLDAGTGRLMTTGEDHSEEGPVLWSATLCQMDETTHGRKGYSRLFLRADMEAGAWLKAEISLDGRPFRQVWATHNERAKTVQIPVLPVRCDNFRLRLSGKGECVIKSIIREFSVGSEN